MILDQNGTPINKFGSVIQGLKNGFNSFMGIQVGMGSALIGKQSSMMQRSPVARKGASPMGNLGFPGGMLSGKKKTRPLTLSLPQLKRLSNTDPIIWSIKKARKDQISQCEWDIIRDTEEVEREIDNWEQTLLDNMNDYKYEREVQLQKVQPKIYGKHQSDIEAIIKDKSPVYEKRIRLRVKFDIIKKEIQDIADQHCIEVRKAFAMPCREYKSLSLLIAMIIDDLLVYDAGIIIKNKGLDGSERMKEMYTLPGDEIFLYREMDNSIPPPPNYAYAWEQNGVQKAEFTDEELVYIQMNPQQWFYGLCVPGDTLIETKEKGRWPIEDIVRRKLEVNVKTYNPKTKKIEYRPIVNWFRRKEYEKLVRIDYGPGGFKWYTRCTKKHPILTSGGWKAAKDITLDDEVMVASPMLTNEQEQIILGSILGGAGMGVKHTGLQRKSIPSYGTGHCKQQADYMKWTINSLRTLKLRNSKRRVKSPHFDNHNTFYSTHTQQLPVLEKLFDVCYKYDEITDKYKKTVTRELLDKLNELGLAVWIMDDGSISLLHRTGKVGGTVICTDGFSKEECKIIVKWFKERWKLETAIYDGQWGPRITFDTRNSRKLLKIISPYLKPNKVRLHTGKGKTSGTKIWCAKPLEFSEKDFKDGIVALPVRSIKYFEGRRSVYDIEVDETHNFLVNKVVMHNSPTEASAYMITASLHIDNMNLDRFKFGNIPEGILNLGKNVTDEQRAGFQALWEQQIRGQGGWHKLLFLNGVEELNHLGLLSSSSKDMQMVEYLKWTLSIKCACFQISPQDLAFTMDLHRTTSEIQYKITKDRGLKSILKAIQAAINGEIVRTEWNYDDIQFKYLDVDVEDENMQAQIDSVDMGNSVITINDRLKQRGKEPIKGGDMRFVPDPRNPSALVPVSMLDDIAQGMEAEFELKGLRPEEETTEEQEPVEVEVPADKKKADKKLKKFMFELKKQGMPNRELKIKFVGDDIEKFKSSRDPYGYDPYGLSRYGELHLPHTSTMRPHRTRDLDRMLSTIPVTGMPARDVHYHFGEREEPEEVRGAIGRGVGSVVSSVGGAIQEIGAEEMEEKGKSPWTRGFVGGLPIEELGEVTEGLFSSDPDERRQAIATGLAMGAAGAGLVGVRQAAKGIKGLYDKSKISSKVKNRGKKMLRVLVRLFIKKRPSKKLLANKKLWEGILRTY